MDIHLALASNACQSGGFDTFCFSLAEEDEPELLFLLFGVQTPQVPPFFAQCLHPVQVVHAVQFSEPVHFLPAKTVAGITSNATNATEIIIFLIALTPLYKL